MYTHRNGEDGHIRLVNRAYVVVEVLASEALHQVVRRLLLLLVAAMR